MVANFVSKVEKAAANFLSSGAENVAMRDSYKLSIQVSMYVCMCIYVCGAENVAMRFVCGAENVAMRFVCGAENVAMRFVCGAENVAMRDGFKVFIQVSMYVCVYVCVYAYVCLAEDICVCI
jgi:hypothetical protein